MVGFSIIKLSKVVAESASKKNFLKSVNIWHSCGQKVDLRRVFSSTAIAVWWPGAETARDNHLIACNFAEIPPV